MTKIGFTTKMRKSVVLEKLQQLIYAPSHASDVADLFKWQRDVEVALDKIFGSDSRHLQEFSRLDIDYLISNYINSLTGNYRDQRCTEELNKARALLESMRDEVKDYWVDEAPKIPDSRVEIIGSTPPNVRTACVFIGHGRSTLWARLKLFLQNDLKLETVEYESETRVGETIVPVLEKMLDQATFAVLVLTAEDVTADGTKRARQNVIHEAGLFQGRLGFRKAVLLLQEGTEEFTNVAGLQYIPFAVDRIEATFYELGRVLRREGVLPTK